MGRTNYNPAPTGIQFWATLSKYNVMSGTYAAKCDTQVVIDAATTSGSNVITSATANFSSADIGKAFSFRSQISITGFGSGTIIGVDSPTSITVSINMSATVTGGVLCWGTDDTAAIQKAVTAANSVLGGAVVIVPGLSMITGGLTLANGVSLIGAGFAPQVPSGSQIVPGVSGLICAAALNATPMVKMGNSTSKAIACAVREITIDGMNQCFFPVDMSGAIANHVIEAAVLAGVGYCVKPGGSQLVSGSVLAGCQSQYIVGCGGDSRIINNWIYGAGANYTCVHIANGDVLVSQNHIWKIAALSQAAGALIDVDPTTNNTDSVNIIENQFDTAMGPNVLVNIATGMNLRALNIADNTAIQNDYVPANTYPYLKLTGAGTLETLNVHGNTGLSSWNTPANGTWTGFFDASGWTGTLGVSNVNGNVLNDVAVGGFVFSNLTPTLGANTNAVRFTDGTHLIG